MQNDILPLPSKMGFYCITFEKYLLKLSEFAIINVNQFRCNQFLWIIRYFTLPLTPNRILCTAVLAENVPRHRARVFLPGFFGALILGRGVLLILSACWFIPDYACSLHCCCSLLNSTNSFSPICHPDSDKSRTANSPHRYLLPKIFLGLPHDGFTFSIVRQTVSVYR